MHVRKSLLALCLALLITTAGCNALGFGAEPTTTPEATTTTTETTTTTTETTTETTTTTTRNATSYPPGIAENGTVMNASALSSAHHRILLQRGGVWQMNVTATDPGYYNRSWEHRISPGGDTLYLDRDLIPTPERYTYWANESLFLFRERAENGTTTYSHTERGVTSTMLDRATQVRRIHHAIDDAEQTSIVETKVIDGVRYTTVRVVQESEETNESATFTFSATGQGLVYSFEYTHSAPRPFNGTVTRSFRLKQTGDVTIERPDWASKALNGTNETSA